MSQELNQLYHYIHDFFSAGLLTHPPAVPRGAQEGPRMVAGTSLFEYMT